MRDWYFVSQQVAGLTETGKIDITAFAPSATGEIWIDKVSLSVVCDDPPVVLPTPTPQPVTPTPCPARAAVSGEPMGLPKIEGVKVVQLLFLPHLERWETGNGGC
jgi:hypothetical protein